MSIFEDTLSEILSDFKKGSKNYAETIIAIESAIVRALGMNQYLFHKQAEMMDFLKKEGI
jgi:hypothetical protein